MSNLSTKETKGKLNKFSNDLNIKLIKGNKNFILYMKEYVLIMVRILEKKPIDSSFKNKQIAFCSN